MKIYLSELQIAYRKTDTIFVYFRKFEKKELWLEVKPDLLFHRILINVFDDRGKQTLPEKEIYFNPNSFLGFFFGFLRVEFQIRKLIKIIGG
jgi:hypothetical protein